MKAHGHAYEWTRLPDRLNSYIDDLGESEGNPANCESLRACAKQGKFAEAVEMLQELSAKILRSNKATLRDSWVSKINHNWRRSGAREFFRFLPGNRLAPKRLFQDCDTGSTVSTPEDIDQLFRSKWELVYNRQPDRPPPDFHKFMENMANLSDAFNLIRLVLLKRESSRMPLCT